MPSPLHIRQVSGSAERPASGATAGADAAEAATLDAEAARSRVLGNRARSGPRKGSGSGWVSPIAGDCQNLYCSGWLEKRAIRGRQVCVSLPHRIGIEVVVGNGMEGMEGTVGIGGVGGVGGTGRDNGGGRGQRPASARGLQNGSLVGCLFWSPRA